MKQRFLEKKKGKRRLRAYRFPKSEDLLPKGPGVRFPEFPALYRSVLWIDIIFLAHQFSPGCEEHHDKTLGTLSNSTIRNPEMPIKKKICQEQVIMKSCIMWFQNHFIFFLISQHPSQTSFTPQPKLIPKPSPIFMATDGEHWIARWCLPKFDKARPRRSEKPTMKETHQRRGLQITVTTQGSIVVPTQRMHY